MTETFKEELINFPRPQFRRDTWKNLNGMWDFAFDDNNEGEKEQWYKKSNFNKTIKVPFTYETKESGIEEEVLHENIWYHRTFEISEAERNKKKILRFQASDYRTKVWVNGIYIGEHIGGNTSFSFDITNEVLESEENSLVVKVEDGQSCLQPRGKQRWKDESFRCWYVQTTGIWQTVWMEFLPPESIKHVKITPDLDHNAVGFYYSLDGDFTNKNVEVKTLVTFKGNRIKELSFVPEGPEMSVDLNLISQLNEFRVMEWSPENPNLYDVTFSLYVEGVLADKVESYFGMRKVSIKDGQVLLNNFPVYQKLLLDQGYWPDTMLTPPSEEALIEDIDKTIEMGFNGVRKHQKLEDERFLYWCDKKGLLVWSEMAAAYKYSDEAVQNFTKEWMEAVNQYYNYPSIITWVPFNESWGVPNILTNKMEQSFTEAIYYLTKSMDNMRPVIVNDGWEQTISDIISLHDYEEDGKSFIDRYQDKDHLLSNKVSHNLEKYPFAKGYEYQGQPVIISEYGGIAFKDEQGWGYGNQVTSEKEFLERYQNITDAIKQIPYISGYCYTQTTDVQQEINGLLDENRVPKVSMEKIKQINDD
ncbi:glycoside hydrolase family 2 protein [Alkalicoccus daliensis]|uniref:Glycosyl hydrolases family 2 n=1 Tax=Alkalicoccus daliensis TaxID=745820 RepID=A0A1H0F7X2_9BACI|nr:sugar-binding domain-containing protein [Alkalicoccus daliensis]SDN90768.1 Glycosyl hydrolases family 2 [Alkalicoccus daliensis]